MSKRSPFRRSSVLFDAVIIGAGVAGLSAAAELAAGRMRVLVLEARDRIGGRVYSLGEHRGIPIQLGAEFVHELEGELTERLPEIGAPIIQGEGKNYFVRKKRLRELDEFFEFVSARLSAARRPRLKDRSIADVLGPPRTETDKHTYRFVEGFNAAPADELSAKALLDSHDEVMKSGGYRSYRVAGGYQVLVDALRREIESHGGTIKTGAVVERVRWRKGEAAVSYRTHSGTVRNVRGRTALITLPPAVLASSNGLGSIRFEPPLPDKTEAASAIGAGGVVKAVLALRDGLKTRNQVDFEHTQFFHLEGSPFQTWWTTYPLRSTILTGWAGGPAAQKLETASADELKTAVLTSLAEILGSSVRVARNAVDFLHVYDWQRDPFSRCAYSFLQVGKLDTPKRLSEPVEKTLFFAGEATADESVGGTVSSAFQSGKSAAGNIQKHAR